MSCGSNQQVQGRPLRRARPQTMMVVPPTETSMKLTRTLLLRRHPVRVRRRGARRAAGAIAAVPVHHRQQPERRAGGAGPASKLTQGRTVGLCAQRPGTTGDSLLLPALRRCAERTRSPPGSFIVKVRHPGRPVVLPAARGDLHGRQAAFPSHSRRNFCRRSNVAQDDWRLIAFRIAPPAAAQPV